MPSSSLCLAVVRPIPLGAGAGRLQIKAQALEST